MNEGQLQKTVLAQSAGLGPASRPVQQGKLAELVNQYEKNNARLNELILIQRDNCTRITGTNPVDEPPEQENVPEVSGVTHDLERAVCYQSDLNNKLNVLTDAWANL